MSKKEQPEKKAFKDWFDKEAVARMGAQISGAWSKFDQKKFERLALRDLNQLEFHGRVAQFSDALAAMLPDDIPEALAILTRSLPEALPDCEQVTDGWLQWPVGKFIADHGLPHFDESFSAMTELTKRFSAEFAVRPFVDTYPEKTFERLLSFTSDPNPHVRRWCSEGVRPRLPWGQKLRKLVGDPTPIWPILEALKDDEELYVRRSVANNLNDISKDHPDLVVARCRAWSKKKSAERQWIIKHGLRTLVKSGNTGALDVIGFGPPKKLSANLTIQPKRVSIGESVELSLELKSSFSKSQKAVIDYVVHYVRKGEKTSEKVFKWKTTELPPNETTSLTKKHSMRATTVRALYPGLHKIEVQINGVRLADSSFQLLTETDR